MLHIHDYYDESTETLYIADVTEPCGCQHDKHLPIIDGLVFHGYMVCSISLADYHDMLLRNDNPVEYSLETFPAPGTCAKNKMGFIPYYEALKIDTKPFKQLS